jgi:hypothetical protein
VKLFGAIALKVSPELGDILDKMVRYDFRQRYNQRLKCSKAFTL